MVVVAVYSRSELLIVDGGAIAVFVERAFAPERKGVAKVVSRPGPRFASKPPRGVKKPLPVGARSNLSLGRDV